MSCKTNAKTEFIEHVGSKTVVCAEIHCKGINSSLKVDHSQEDYQAFLTAIDYKYDAGYGCQELYGTIWYADGTWSDRKEYDGSEGWDHFVRPDIPMTLK